MSYNSVEILVFECKDGSYSINVLGQYTGQDTWCFIFQDVWRQNDGITRLATLYTVRSKIQTHPKTVGAVITRIRVPLNWNSAKTVVFG